MERLGVEVRKQGPHERVLAEDLGGPFPRLNRGSSGGRRTHSPNGRGTACDGRTGSSSGCSRTGRTVPAAAVPGAELRQNLGDPAHIREGGPRQSTGDLMTAVQGSQVRPMAIGLYETEKFQLLGNGDPISVKGTAEDTEKPLGIQMEICQEGLNKKDIYDSCHRPRMRLTLETATST